MDLKVYVAVPQIPEPAPPTVSPLFCDRNADITFKSSDDVLFKIFKKHLDSTSAGFTVPENGNGHTTIIDPSDYISLDETSDVLELLFQFIHPPSEDQNLRQPSVMTMDSDLFFDLAEAAEKYIVYSAMGVCITWMEQIFPLHPAEVLNHCAKHDYPALGDKAAAESLALPFEEIARELTHPGLLSQWMLYYGWFSTMMKDNLSRFNSYQSCPVIFAMAGSYAQQFLRDPRLVYSVPGSPLGINCPTSRCPCRLGTIQGIISSMPQARPKLSEVIP